MLSSRDTNSTKFLSVTYRMHRSFPSSSCPCWKTRYPNKRTAACRSSSRGSSVDSSPMLQCKITRNLDLICLHDVVETANWDCCWWMLWCDLQLTLYQWLGRQRHIIYVLSWEGWVRWSATVTLDVLRALLAYLFSYSPHRGPRSCGASQRVTSAGA